MRLFPTREVTIETKLRVEEIIKRLSEYVEKPQEWYKYRWPLEIKPFEGELTNNRFSLTSTHLIDTYLKITGEICGRPDGTVVNIQIKSPFPIYHRSVRNIIFVSAFIVFGMLAFSVLKSIVVRQQFTLLIIVLVLTPLLAAVISYIVAMIGQRKDGEDDIDVWATFFVEHLKE